MPTVSDPYRLFLDSGAHSLFNLHQQKSGRSRKSEERWAFYRTREFAEYMDRYAEFVRRYEDVLTVYANVDVIGNPDLTYRAQKYLEKKGIRPIPVIHFGTDLKWVQRYLDEGYEYIALGGLKGIGRNAFVQWADRVFDLICNTPDRLPKVKVHGFAVTSVKVMLRYPWYSVDSTTWCVYARNGVVMIPQWDEITKSYVYNENILPIVFSHRSPSIEEVGSRHFFVLPKRTQDKVAEYIEKMGYKIGVSELVTVPVSYALEGWEEWAEDEEWEEGKKVVQRPIVLGVSNNYIQRDEVNILYFLELAKHIPTWPWPFMHSGTQAASEGLGI